MAYNVRRYRHRWFWGLFLALTFSLAGLIGSAFRYQQSYRLIHEHSLSSAWALVQLQEEHRRFINTLRLYQLQGVNKQQLLFRYNIFWSRFPVLLSGSETERLDQVPGARALISDMFAEVQRIEPMLDALPDSSVEIPNVLGWMENFSTPINVMVNREFHRQSHQQLNMVTRLRHEYLWFAITWALLALSVLLLMLLLVALYRQNRWLNHHDSITGLSNRETLEQVMADLAELHQPYAIFVVDVSSLLWSERLHQPLIHNWLKFIADNLTQLETSPLEVSYIGRYQFALLTHSSDESEWHELWAKMIRKQLAIPYHFAGEDYAVIPKIGVAHSDPKQESSPLELAQAELSISPRPTREKQSVAVYHEQLVRQVVRERELQTEFSTALLQQQFELRYQPVVRSDSLRPVALQAQVRWVHDKWGWIEADELAAMATSLGEAETLLVQTLKASLKDHKIWQQSDGQLALMFPIPAEMLNESLCLQIMMALRSERMLGPSFMLILSLNQRVLPQKVQSFIQQLRSSGVHIVVDGPLELSLERVSMRYSGEFIKLSAALVASLTQAGGEAYLEAFSRCLSAMRCLVMCDGVASQEQLQLLREYLPDSYVSGSAFSPYLGRVAMENYLHRQYQQVV